MFGKKKAPAPVAPKNEVNADLANERLKCSFNVQELTNFLDGGEDKCRERRQKEEFYLSDPELKEGKVPSELLSHEDQYREAVRKCNILFRKMDTVTSKRDVAELDIIANRSSIGIRIGTAIFKDGNPFSLHNVMFIPVIQGQGTEEQKAYWLKRALNMEFFGTYAQTELGHGTFIRGLETTATYRPETEQFEMNSPTLSSYKWWPGGMGHTSNYAIVMAQLYTQGVCHGVHPFIVQLRDEKSFKPMPGITVGEIGHKFGMNATNNGFLAFDKVLIPRNHMLMKNSQVAKDGTYSKTRKGNNKLAYGGMIFVRVIIVDDMSFWVSKVATIAVRYSAVRRQSEMKPGEREPQILDYQTQQYKLFPFIAYAYAFKFTSLKLWDIYNTAMSSLDQGDVTTLPELHGMACCLKAVCTADGLRAVEIMRLACGGHGYMTCSNLPTTYALVAATNTYEGENTVMLLQTARALMKAFNRAQSGERLTGTVAYLSERSEGQGSWSNSLDSLVQGFKKVAAGKVSQCGVLLQQAMSSGLAPEVAWNSVSQQLTGAAEAHGRTFLVQSYVEAVRTSLGELSPPLREVMGQLCELYCVYWALVRTGDFLMFTGMRGSDVAQLEAWQSRLLAALRPNAVGLVDAFDFRDEILASALGSWDGRVYERLLASAMQSPLNAKPVHDSFYSSIAPLLKAKY